MCVEEGMAEAKNNLAGLYFEEENYDEAIKYYKEAIENGCKESFENIGDLYYKIDDKEQSLSFYLRRSDNIGCQVKIGNIYEEFENYDEAIIWYKKASDSGDSNSSYKLGEIYKNLGNNQESKKYFKLATEKNNLNAYINLGKLYFDAGEYEESKKYFEVPANEGNTYCEHMVGLIYDIFYKEYDNAKYWYEKARTKKCIESIYNLGLLNLRLKEYSEAEKYFKEGLQSEHSRCEYILAWLYYKKSLDMYTSLGHKDYEDSKEIVSKMPNISIDLHKSLIGKFELQPKDEYEEEYVPIYILQLKENIEDMFENPITDMIIDK